MGACTYNGRPKPEAHSGFEASLGYMVSLELQAETLCVENLFGRVNVGTALHGS